MTAKVVVNRSRQAAILAKQGRVYVHLIRSTAHGLYVEKITDDQLMQDWSELKGYDVSKAVDSFGRLSNKPRTTKEARHLLYDVATELLEEA